MMFTITKEKDKQTNNIQEFICDFEIDINNLPIDIAAGSTAFVIENSSAYMLNNSKIWVKI